MPNINLLQTITTASDNTGYFIMSNNGLARRYKFSNFLSQLQATIPDANRTDQNLFTTDDVQFQSVVTKDFANTVNEGEHVHGFQSEPKHSDGTGIKAGDFIGSLRFGGFDGQNYTISDSQISVVGITALALENWSYSGANTLGAGAGYFIYHQPVKLQLTTSSRVTSFYVISTSTNAALPPTSVIRIGVVPNEAVPVTTSSDGAHTYSGPGRADLFFANSRIYQQGIPVEDTSPVNATLTGTNSFTFISSRTNTYGGARQPVKTGDTLGSIIFRGTNAVNSANFGVEAAQIRGHATTDFSASVHGGSIHIMTCSTASGAVTQTTLDIDPDRILYTSDRHVFYDKHSADYITLTSGTIEFQDYTTQSTAYPGFAASVPVSSSSTGIKGQIAYDSSYIYVCVDTNTWKRIAASDF